MLIEIILGERPPTGVQAPIEYSIVNEGFRATINGEAVFEPVAPFRALFAKLKARDNLLGAVLARLGLKAGDADQAPEVLGRMLEDRMESATWADTLTGAMSKIAKGLGLRDGGAMMKPDDLAAQVLAMNTELTAALAKAEAKRDEAIAEAINERKGRAAAEAEVRDPTSALERVRRELDEERLSTAAEIDALTRKLAEAEMERIMATASATGMRAALNFMEHTLREKLRT